MARPLSGPGGTDEVGAGRQWPEEAPGKLGDPVKGQYRPEEPAPGKWTGLTAAVDRAVLKVARHWLALLTLFWGLYVGLPLLAPALMLAGWETPARVIYLLYRPACHQRPERSYFVGGPQAVYTADELTAAGVDLDPGVRDIGNAAVGWKVAFCERDLATYGAIFLAGLGFGLVRRRLRPMRIRTYLLFVLPLAIDGTLQLFGLYESNWIVRTATGVWFGLGTVLFAYPHLEAAFGDVGALIDERRQAE